MTDDIDLGMTAQDRVSNFEGIVTAVAYHLTGCTRFELTANDDDTTRNVSEWFDQRQVGVINDDVIDSLYNSVDSMDPDVSLGVCVRDEVTGVEGVVIVITYEAFNCPKVGIQPIDTSTTIAKEDIVFADVPRVTVVGEGVTGEYTEQQTAETATASGSAHEDINRTPSR